MLMMMVFCFGAEWSMIELTEPENDEVRNSREENNKTINIELNQYPHL